MDNSWDYRSRLDPEGDLPDEWIWERLRNKRDDLLTMSDFRMVNDAPWDRAPWETYRQALRDLPKTTKNPRLAEWPVSPNE